MFGPFAQSSWVGFRSAAKFDCSKRRSFWVGDRRPGAACWQLIPFIFFPTVIGARRATRPSQETSWKRFTIDAAARPGSFSCKMSISLDVLSESWHCSAPTNKGQSFIEFGGGKVEGSLGALSGELSARRMGYWTSSYQTRLWFYLSNQ